jgi:hypothetical protein
MKAGTRYAQKLFPDRHELYKNELSFGIKFDIRPMEEPPQMEQKRRRYPRAKCQKLVVSLLNEGSASMIYNLFKNIMI